MTHLVPLAPNACRLVSHSQVPLAKTAPVLSEITMAEPKLAVALSPPRLPRSRRPPSKLEDGATEGQLKKACFQKLGASAPSRSGDEEASLLCAEVAL